MYTHKPVWNNSKTSFTFLKDRNCSNMCGSNSFINWASQNNSYKSWVQLAIFIKINRQKSGTGVHIAFDIFNSTCLFNPVLI